MRVITKKELSEILEKHRRWIIDGCGGKRADLQNVDLQNVDLHNVDLSHADLYGANLRCANLQGANLQGVDLQDANLLSADLRNVDLYTANLENVERPWLVCTGPIGSRLSRTRYFADYDNIRCGCWNNYNGGTLAEFKERINEVYPADSESEACQRYRLEYLSAIKMFESMRKAYLSSVK